MSKLLTIVALLTMAVTWFPAASVAQVELRPAMIIRFNQPLVSFERQLSIVVQQAQAIKSDVRYDLIQYTPKISSTGQLLEYDEHKSQVLIGFASLGVSEEQVRFGRSYSPDVESDEIYIFVH